MTGNGKQGPGKYYKRMVISEPLLLSKKWFVKEGRHEDWRNKKRKESSIRRT